MDLPLVNTDARRWIALDTNPTAGATTRLATARINPVTILRMLYLASDLDTLGVSLVRIRLAYADIPIPTAEAFTSGDFALNTLGTSTRAPALFPDPTGSANWWPVNVRLPNRIGRILMEVLNLNSTTIRIHMRAVLDQEPPGASHHGRR